MDDLIKSGKKKIQDLDSDALAEEINSKFKLLHIMAIEYSQALAGAGLFLSVLVHLQFLKIYFVINKLCNSSLDTYVTLYSHVLTNSSKGFRMHLPVFSDILSPCFSMVKI